MSLLPAGAPGRFRRFDPDREHPTSINANLNLQVTGPTVAAGAAHAKIRRADYTGNTNWRPRHGQTAARDSGGGPSRLRSIRVDGLERPARESWPG
ncbi:hypothetical protein E0504_37570 [Parafrankia sp. BMG5.11]|nr:hypothetical protein E0504_37570 [Parafrankia sp. BMG5.11]